MTNTIGFKDLAALVGAVDSPEGFTPVARYYSGMDFVLYLNKDCSYRADRVDEFLTLLWHPTEDNLVGVKLKGFRCLFQAIKKVLDFKETDFVPLVKALELAMFGGLASRIALTKDVNLPPEELFKIAA